MRAFLLILLSAVPTIAVHAAVKPSCTCNALAGNFPGVVLSCNGDVVAGFPFSSYGEQGAGDACQKAMNAYEQNNPAPTSSIPAPNPNFIMDCTGDYVPSNNNSVKMEIDVENGMLSYEGTVTLTTTGAGNVLPIQTSFPVKRFGSNEEGLPYIQTQVNAIAAQGQPAAATLEMFNGGGYDSLTPGVERDVAISEGVLANQGLPGILMSRKYYLYCHIRY